MSEESSLWNWARQPSSWLALIALAMSAATFFLVQASPGDLLVILPDSVGILRIAPLNAGAGQRLSLLLPLTLTNTGAPCTWRHITQVAAELEATEPATQVLRVNLAWEFEHRFLGSQQYLEKYKKALDEGTVDYLDYEGRAFPFALRGGESTARLFQLRGNLEGQQLSRLESFTLLVTVKTTRGYEREARQFRCNDRIGAKEFQWCSSKAPYRE